MTTYYTISVDNRVGGLQYFWEVRRTLETPQENPRIFKTKKAAQEEADKRNRG